MKNLREKYDILKLADFRKVAIETGYSYDYVRQVIRGYIAHNPRHQLIISKADKLLQQKIKSLNK